MKTILLPIHDDAGQGARLAAARSLALVLGGHLLCLDLIRMPQLFADYVSGAGRAMELDEEERRAQINRHRINEELAKDGLSYEWTTPERQHKIALDDAIQFADIVVVSRDDDHRTGIPVGALFGASNFHGKPILSVDAERVGFTADGRAMVVWDGSIEAANLLRLSTDLLGRAAAVEIFAVEGKQALSPPEEAAEYLGRHGVEAVITPHPSDGHALSDWLDIRCVMWRADYCVMATFAGESISDRLFATTTRRFLRRTRLPMLIGG